MTATSRERRRAPLLALLVLLGAAAGCSVDSPALCTQEDGGIGWGHGGALMLPGTDCLSCHQAGGKATGHPFTIAGTVFRDGACRIGLAGAVVRIRDGAGQGRSLVTNEAGNFYTSEALTPPFVTRVEVGGSMSIMPQAAHTGACNSCHAEGSALGVVWPSF